MRTGNQRFASSRNWAMSAPLTQKDCEKLCQVRRIRRLAFEELTSRALARVYEASQNRECQTRALQAFFVALVLTSFRCQLVTSLRVFGMLVVLRK